MHMHTSKLLEHLSEAYKHLPLSYARKDYAAPVSSWSWSHDAAWRSVFAELVKEIRSGSCGITSGSELEHLEDGLRWLREEVYRKERAEAAE